MSWLLIILCLAIFIYLTWRNIVWGIALVIVLLPSYIWRASLFGLPTTFLELSLLSLFVIWLVKDKNYKRINFRPNNRSQNRLDIFLRILLATWLIISMVAVTVHPTLGALGLWRAYFLEPMFFFLVMIYSIRDARDIKTIVGALGALLALLFLSVVVQQFTGLNLPAAYDFPNQHRLTGIYNYPNALSLITAPLASFFLGLWIYSKKKKENWWYLALFIIGLVICLGAVSQGALVGILFSLLLWLILAKNVRKLGILLLLLIIIASLFLAPLKNAFASFGQQLFRPVLDLNATSLEIRSSQWSETWAMLQDRWFLGAGLAGYQQAVAPFHTASWLEIYLYPHNIFLNFWTELGVLGLICFVLLLIYIVQRLWILLQKQNYFAWPLVLFWTTWLVHGLVDVPYFKNDLSIVFFLGLALTIWAENIEDKSPEL